MIETNELTRKLRMLLHPRAALIVYAQENNSHSMNDNSYFIEVRDIDESGRMGEGRSVTVEFMNDWYGDIQKVIALHHTAGFRPTCCGANRARAARNTSGTTIRREG